MIIYHSTAVRPYVYMGIHKVTGEIYIGSRWLNVKLCRTSDVDLPIYKTSSKVVNPQFDEFDWYIVAEFSTSNDAYDFEQQLIYENWNNPLLLNKNCHYGKKRFKSIGANKGKKIATQTPESIAKRVAKQKGQKRTAEQIAINSAHHLGQIPWNKGIVQGRRDKRPNYPRLTCPYCHREGTRHNMLRWHFDQCKFIVRN